MRIPLVLSIVVVATSCALLVERENAHAQGRSLDDIARGESSSFEDEDALEPIKNKVFSPFRSKIRALCASLEVDRRREQLLQIAGLAAGDERGCRACGPLGRLFESSCAAAKAPRSFPVTSIGRLQREPHPSAIQDAAQLGRELANSNEAGAESAIFIARMFGSTKELSPAGREYFASLEEALSRPLRKFLRSGETGGGVSRASEVRPLSQDEREELLNDMF